MHTSHRVDELAERATRLYIRTLWIFMPAAWIFQQVLAARHYLDSDGIAYADMAYQCVQGNWRALVNGYWSPGYPALLSLWLAVVHPSPYREIIVVRVLNCIFLFGALCCFRFFLGTVLETLDAKPIGENGYVVLPRFALEAVGYTLFFWATVVLDPFYVNAPDILVFAALLLAAGVSVQIVNGKGGLWHFALLGIVLGAGYLVKTAMLPIAAIFLLAMLLKTHKRPGAVRGLVLSIIMIGIVCSPFVYSLSKLKGRFTFGDSGSINYAIAVNWIDISVYWQGEPPGSGTPAHPPRKLLDVPEVYEFDYPIPVSYPAWYDHSYWYEGVRPHFQLKRQLNVVHLGVRAYYEIIFERLGVLVAGYLILLLTGDSLKNYARRLLNLYPLWGPVVVGLGMYALVHVEPRFLGGFIVLGLAACFLALRVKPFEIAPTLVRAVTLAIVIGLGVQILAAVGHNGNRAENATNSSDWKVVEQLQSEGVEPGDKVSYIGNALTDHVWAHLARVSIVSEIPLRDEASFWAAPPELKTKVYSLLEGSGAKAVIAKHVPAEFLSGRWRQVAGTEYHILKLAP